MRSFLHRIVKGKTNVFAVLMLMIAMGVGQRSWGQVTLPHYDGLNYTVGQGLETQTGWTTLNTGDALLMTTGNLSYTGLPSSTGNKITFDGAGIDAAKLFTQQTSGTVYYSFLVNVTALGSLNTTGGYFAGFTEGATTNFGATVWTRSDGSGFDIGLNPRTTVANTVWTSGTTAINTTILVVVSYQIVASTGNDIVKLWINPTPGNTEPTATLTATNTGGTDLANLNRILIRQDAAAATPFIQMDEFRIGATWASVTPQIACGTLTITPSSASICTGGSGASLTASATNATGYTWSPAGGLSATTGATVTANPGSTTTYTATATGCSGGTGTVAVTVNTAPTVNSPTITDVLCKTAATGAVTLNLSGGSAPFTYLWSNGATSQDITGLATGAYSVTITSTGGCTVSAGPYTVNEPASALTYLTLTKTVGCAGGSGSSVTCTGVGGTGAYQYSLNNGSFQPTGSFSNLADGINTVTVKDANACTWVKTYNFIPLSATAAATPVLCNNTSTAITVTGANGQGTPYTYSIDGNTYGTDPTFTVKAGTYTLRVKDANNCIAATTPTLVTEPVAVNMNTTVKNVTCSGTGGSLTTTGTGGTGAFQYILMQGVTTIATNSTGIFANLSAGSYQLTAKDANNCSRTKTYVVGTSALLAVSASAPPILCNNNATILTASASGGYGSYLYSIDNGVNYQSNKAFSIKDGSYVINVKDGNNCIASTPTIVITEPAALNLSTTVNNTVCNNSNGSLVTSGTGGTQPYQFKLGNGSYSAVSTFTGLAAGSYTLTVKDANNCTRAKTYTVYQVPCNSIFAQSAADDIVVNMSTVKVFPNPSNTVFNLTIQSKKSGKISIIVTDMFGKQVYLANGTNNQQYKFGERFASGLYIVKIVEGKQVKTIKLVKD